MPSTAETLSPAEIEALRSTPALRKLSIEEQRAEIEAYRVEAEARQVAKDRAVEAAETYAKVQAAHLAKTAEFVESACSYANISQIKRETWREARNLDVAGIGIEPPDLSIRAANEREIANTLVELRAAAGVR